MSGSTPDTTSITKKNRSFDTFLKSSEEGLGLSGAFVKLIKVLGINSFERLLSLSSDISVDMIVECIGSTTAKKHPQDVKMLGCFPRFAGRCVGNNEFRPELFNPPYCFRDYMCKRTRGLNIQLRESINRHSDRPAAKRLFHQRMKVKPFFCHKTTPDSGETLINEMGDTTNSDDMETDAFDTSVTFPGGVHCNSTVAQRRSIAQRRLVQRRPMPKSMRWNGKRATMKTFQNEFEGWLIQEGLGHMCQQHFPQAHEECGGDITSFPTNATQTAFVSAKAPNWKLKSTSNSFWEWMASTPRTTTSSPEVALK